MREAAEAGDYTAVAHDRLPMTKVTKAGFKGVVSDARVDQWTRCDTHNVNFHWHPAEGTAFDARPCASNSRRCGWRTRSIGRPGSRLPRP